MNKITFYQVFIAVAARLVSFAFLVMCISDFQRIWEGMGLIQYGAFLFCLFIFHYMNMIALQLEKKVINELY